MHGHSYIIDELVLTVEQELDKQGICIDFSEIKGYFKTEWDHKNLVPESHVSLWEQHYTKLGMDLGSIKPLKFTTCEHIKDTIVKDLMTRFSGIIHVMFNIYEGASESSGGEFASVNREEVEENCQ